MAIAQPRTSLVETPAVTHWPADRGTPNGRASEEVVVLAIGRALRREETRRGAVPGIAQGLGIARVPGIEGAPGIEVVLGIEVVPGIAAVVPSAGTRVGVLVRTAVADDQVWEALADTAALAAALVEAAVDSAEAEVDSAEAAAAVGGEGENHEKNINQAISICWRYDRRYIRWRLSSLLRCPFALSSHAADSRPRRSGRWFQGFRIGASGCGSACSRYRDI